MFVVAEKMDDGYCVWGIGKSKEEAVNEAMFYREEQGEVVSFDAYTIVVPGNEGGECDEDEVVAEVVGVIDLLGGEDACEVLEFDDEELTVSLDRVRLQALVERLESDMNEV